MTATDGQRTLRLLSPEDDLSAYTLWLQNPTTLQYLESRWQAHTLATTQAYVQQQAEDPNSFLFGIFIAADGTEGPEAYSRHIGNIKLHILHPVPFSHLNLHSLTAGMYAANEASFHAFLKAGFWECGHLQEAVFLEGQYHDIRMVHLTAPHWHQHHD